MSFNDVILAGGSLYFLGMMTGIVLITHIDLNWADWFIICVLLLNIFFSLRTIILEENKE